METMTAVLTEKPSLSFAARLAIAYEHYRFVTQDQVAIFNRRLKEQTLKRFQSATGSVHDQPVIDSSGTIVGRALYSKYDVLNFSDWDSYKGTPPGDVMEAASKANDLGIFDVLEVAKVQSEVEYHDPILFGRILGCGDRFFIAQWDNDVKIDDLIGPNEG